MLLLLFVPLLRRRLNPSPGQDSSYREGPANVWQNDQQCADGLTHSSFWAQELCCAWCGCVFLQGGDLLLLLLLWIFNFLPLGARRAKNLTESLSPLHCEWQQDDSVELPDWMPDRLLLAMGSPCWTLAPSSCLCSSEAAPMRREPCATITSLMQSRIAAAPERSLALSFAFMPLPPALCPWALPLRRGDWNLRTGSLSTSLTDHYGFLVSLRLKKFPTNQVESLREVGSASLGMARFVH